MIGLTVRRLANVAAFAAAWMMITAPRGAAEVAKITTVVRVVQYSAGGEGRWLPGKVGIDLDDGDKVRTGQRSATEVRFADNSIVRLAALSDMEVRGGKDITLKRGKLLGDFKTPGKVKCGATVANVKGSRFTITVLENGDIEVILYEGSIVLDTPLGVRELNVNPGDKPIRALVIMGIPPGQTERTIREVRIEEPSDDVLLPSFDMPREGTTVYELPGSGEHILIRDDNITVNENADAVDEETADEIINGEGEILIEPLEPPDPPDQFPEGEALALSHSSRAMQALRAINRVGGPSQAMGGLRALRRSRFARRLGAATPRANISDSAYKEATGGGAGAGAQGASAAPATYRPSYFAPRFDGDVATFLFDGGSMAAGRFHGKGMNGGYFWDVAVAPLSFSGSGSDVDLTDAYVAARTPDGGLLTIGRQRFLKGPVQNTIFGTLIRQNGRDIQDAVTYSAPLQGTNRSLDLSYLIDAYPSGLPTMAPGLQSGWYGRFGVQSKRWGNFGLNATNDDFSPDTGMTVDFGVPVFPNQVDLYGEFGQDTFNGKIRTLGLYFGGLYQRYGIDMFLERAWLGHPINTVFVPSETLLRVYRKFGQRYTGVLLVDRKDGAGNNYDFGIGLVTKLPGF